MELEQLVSFVRYQRGQKNGWDALDEVLTIVQDSKDLVAKNQALCDQHAQAIEDMKVILATLDATRLAKLADLDKELESVRESREKVLRTNEVALGRAINEKTAQSQDLDDAIAKSLINLQSLRDQETVLGARITEAIDKYNEIQAKLAAIKGTL